MTDRKILTSFGQRIKLIRKASKISQEKLADLTELHPTYISRIESGKANPTLIIMHKIASVLKVDTSTLLSDLTSAMDQASSAKLTVVLSKLKKHNAKSQQKILDAIDMLISK